MIGPDSFLAVCALVVAVGAGLVVHESAHAFVLRLAGVEYSVRYFAGRDDGVVGALASCPWAVVQPHPTGREPAWVLRLAALAPLSLAFPVLALGVNGSLPTNQPALTALALGWLACALPSPQDFSVAFYAHRVLEETRADGSAAGHSR